MNDFSRNAILYHLGHHGGIPKNFRVWDELHKRWFQGDFSQKARDYGYDSAAYFGENLIMNGTLYDQHADDAWQKSPETPHSLDRLDWLTVVQCTGSQDENGDWIYEGDILITDDNLIGYVAFDPAIGFNLYSPYHGVVLTKFSTCVIKGNIFQHYDQWFKDLDDEDKWTACCNGKK